MKAMLQSSWFVAVVGSALYLATTAALLRPGMFAAAHKAETVPTVLTPSNDPSWKFRNPEFEQWVQELRTERQSLEDRRKELRDWEARLQAERQEILAVTQAVHQIQLNFEKTLVIFDQQELENAKHQAKVFSGISPDGAAVMVREMPDDQVLRLLYALKPERAGAILDALSKSGKNDATRAATLTSRLARVLPPDAKSSNSTGSAP